MDERTKRLSNFRQRLRNEDEDLSIEFAYVTDGYVAQIQELAEQEAELKERLESKEQRIKRLEMMIESSLVLMSSVL